MHMKVLFINPGNPPGHNLIIIPPIGLGYLAAYIRERHQVSILDIPKEKLHGLSLRQALENTHFDIAGVTLYSSAFNTAFEVIRLIKNIKPKAKLVLGGPHPTFEPVSTLNEIREADIAFLGEAEIGFSKYLDLLESSPDITRDQLSNIPGIGYRDNGNVFQTPQQFLNDLNQYPWPAWDLLQPQTYPLMPNGIFSREPRCCPIITTRGCPYPCSFCGAGKMQGKRIRKRDPQNVIDEILFIRKNYNIHEFHFLDDALTVDRNHAMGLFERLASLSPKIVWASTNGVRLDSLDSEMVRAMERSGCYSLAVGIESGSPRILDDLNKKVDQQTLREKIRMIKANSKIRLTGFFILGYPTEEESDVQATIDESCSLPIDRANYFNYSPFPGSQIYYELKENGRIREIDYNKLYIHSISFQHPKIRDKQLRWLIRKAYLRFYLRPKILWGIAKEIKSLSQITILVRRVIAIFS